MQMLAQLDHEHVVLDATINHFDALLQRPRQAHPTDVRKILQTLIHQLSAHLQFEASMFSLPLQASGHARPDVMDRLSAEHQDLQATLHHLEHFCAQPRLLNDEIFLLYSAHLIDLYREHSDREHQCLCPALEQLPSAHSRHSTLVPFLEIDSSRVTS